jgi:DNA-binding response OmpR family regulator
MSKILLVEDDKDLAQKIRQRLEVDKYIVEIADSGEEALELLKTYTYDVVVLDWGLPGMGGVEVCANFRASGGSTPILFLTGKNDILSKETGLDSGADDYLTKPFHMRELTARIRSLLRRAEVVTKSVLTVGPLTMDTDKHSVEVNNVEVRLKPKEFALLEFLIRHPDHVFSADALLDKISKSDSSTSSETIYTYIKTLRQKLTFPDGSSPIQTVHGVGYKFVSPSAANSE